MTPSRRSDVPFGSIPVSLAALCVGILAGLGLGIAPGGVARAIEVPGPTDERVAALAACDPDATALIVVVAGLADPSVTEVVADFVGRTATLDRDAEILVLSGVDAEGATSWEPVGSTTAGRVRGFLADVEVGELGDGQPLDPAAIDQARGELADRAGELAEDDTDTCGLVVVAHGALLDDPADPVAGDDVVVAAGDHREVAAELEAMMAALDAARTSITPLGVCAGERCPEGSTTIEADPLLGRFAFTVLLPVEPAQVLVELPRGVELPVDPSGGPIDAGSFTLTATWVTPQILRLDAEVSPLDGDWSGDWTLTVVDPDRTEAAPVGSAQVMTTLSAGLDPRVMGTPVLVADREVAVEVELYDRSGRYVEADEVPGEAEVRATVVDGEGVEVVSASLEPTELGRWSGTLVAPAPEAGGAYRLRASFDASDVDGPLPSRVTTGPVGMLGPEVVPVLDSTPVRVRGDAGSVARGELVVTAGQGRDACVWLAEGSDPGVVVGEGAASPASCVGVRAGEVGSVPISVDTSDLEAGSYSTTAVVALGIGDAPALELVEVDVAVEVLAPVDSTRRLAVAALLGLAGLAAPLLALWVFDAARARFRPSKAAVAIDIGVVVRSDGSLHRSGPDASPLILSDDMCEPAQLGRGRRSEWRGLRFAVRNPLSPFRPPVAVVGSPDGPVVAHLGAIVDDDDVVGRVAPGLGSTWIFVLDPDATRAAAADTGSPDFFAAHGRLVLIRSSIEADPVDVSALGRQAQRLARTVRSARPGGGDGEDTTREMLDFVDVNVSTPRDLPRRASRPEAAIPESPDAKLARWEEYEGLGADDGLDDLEADERSTAGDVDADELDLPVWEPGGRVPDEHAGETEAGDEADEAEEGVGIGFGIVFEDHVNPRAFLDESEPAPGLTGPGGETNLEAEPGGSDHDELGWARRSRPRWPTVRKRDDT